MLNLYAEKKNLRQPSVNQFVDHIWEKPRWSATPCVFGEITLLIFMVLVATVLE